jgi:dTMP kinase
MERENIDFYEKVRAGYLVLAKGMPERFAVIDGTKREDVIEKQVWAAVQERLVIATKPKSKPAKRTMAKV